ncbi:MAG TPA: dienelactone hydrolase family protein [Polyangiaceae bacterium]|nr:dienelactone hydrolase family protein [Polyangiaceae bacterium]
MGQLINLRRPDGATCPAYTSVPDKAEKAPGIVVIQEWWGLNEQIKKTADRLAKEGYRTVVPDLFRGKIAKSSDEASHLMNHLNFVDAADQDIQGCVTYLRETSSRIGVTGFCMGGALTLLSALRVKGVDAGACFYGMPPKTVFDATQVAVPLILHFANTDDWCTPELVTGLKADLERSRSKFELHRYDAEHAFMNEARPEVYEPKSAALAWQRTLAFFDRTLRG